MKNLIEMVKNCYKASQKKGFWDTKRNQAEAFALILSELNEAFEAHRKGKFANLGNQEFVSANNDSFVDLFKLKVKDTVEDELADVLIRLFDFCGGFNISTSVLDTVPLLYRNVKEVTNFGEKVLLINYYSTDAYFSMGSHLGIREIYKHTLDLCEELNIDIEKHIELKLQYNATRGYKHDKQY